MDRDRGEQEMCRPLVNRKNIDPPVGPKALRTVADGDQQAQTKIQSGQKHREESGIGGQAERGHVDIEHLQLPCGLWATLLARL